MLNRISIYFTRTFSQVEIGWNRGASRNAQGKTMIQVIENMSDADKTALVALCSAIVDCAGDGNCKALLKF